MTSWLAQALGQLITFLLLLALAAVLFGRPGSLGRLVGGLRKERSHSPPHLRAANTIAVAAQMVEMVRPTFLMVAAKEAVFSKFGGSPDLPSDLTWPGAGGSRHLFLAQVDLAEVHACEPVDWLPPTGKLYAFLDERGLDSAEMIRVLFSQSPPDVSAGQPSFVERRVRFERRSSLPSPDWLGLDATELDCDPSHWAEAKAVDDAPPSDVLQHRVGGYPNEIQVECMRLTCEHLARELAPPRFRDVIEPGIEGRSWNWQLLLQIDSDPALKMNWGDGGRLYVFVREQDARSGDFSQTVSIWQTY